MCFLVLRIPSSWFSTSARHSFKMKTPERSRTSHVGQFLVLLPHNSLFDATWRHSVTSYCDVTCCHIIGHVTQIVPDISPWCLITTKWNFTWWPWPTTLTYNPSLDKVKVNSHIKNQGHRSNCSVMRVRTDRQTDTHEPLRFYDLDRWRGR